MQISRKMIEQNVRYICSALEAGFTLALFTYQIVNKLIFTSNNKRIVGVRPTQMNFHKREMCFFYRF